MWEVLAAFGLGAMFGCLVGPILTRRDYLAGITLGEKWGADKFKMSFAGPVYCGKCSNQLEEYMPLRCKEKE